MGTVKFRCDRDALSEALQTVQRGVSSRPGIPALTGVLIEATDEGQLILATTDLEVSARLSIDVQVSQAGIAGSTRLGNYVVMAGQSGLIGHLDIGDGAIITAQSGLTKDVPAGGVMSGSPASERRTHLKELAALSKLPEALQEIRKLRQEIQELRRSTTS